MTPTTGDESDAPTRAPRAGARRRPLRAALVVSAATVLLSAGEYVAWDLAGEANEWSPLVMATLVLALGGGLLAGGAGLFLSPALAVTAGAIVPLAVFGRAALELAHAGRVPALAGGLVLGLLVALGLAAFASRAAFRRALVGLALVAVAGAWGLHRAHLPRKPAPARSDLPDVVLLVMDTTRPDRLSVYGYDKPTTPNLERFAEGAQVYEEAWSVAPWTSPSHATMLTGLLPAEHGVDGFATFPSLGEHLVTLPGLLSEAGYHTAGFVANTILTAPGWRRDFDTYLTARFTRRHTLVAYLNRFLRGATLSERNEHATEHILGRARDWWAAHDDAPRFLFLNLLDPHGKYRPLPEFWDTFLPGVAPAEALVLEDRYSPAKGEHDYTPRELELLGALYDGELAGMDREIGRFTDWLAARGDLDDTIFVMTADHGERLGERGTIGHKLLNDPYLLRVPLIARFPRALEPGRIRRRVQLDGLPGFVLELAGLRGTEEMHARALQRQDRELIVAQLSHPWALLEDLQSYDEGFDPRPYDGDWYFVCDEDLFCLEWQVLEDGARGRLTDFRADPDFRDDVSAEHPDRLERLRARAAELPAYHGLSTKEVDEDGLEVLRGLGYVQ